MVQLPVFGGGGGETGGAGTGGSSNQWFGNMPSMFTPSGAGNPSGFNFGSGGGSGTGFDPYQVPSSSAGGFSPYSGSGSANSPFGWPNISGTHAVPPQYPGVGGTFANWLQSQIGQGVTPFNLSTPLPTGGKTAPGQLTAGENPLLQQLQAFFSGQGSNSPGANTLSTIANKGISALPEWQSMIAAMQQPIQQQTANLREQFASMGDLAGSPFGTAMANFGEQTSLNEQSLLGQLTQQNILQGQIPTAEFLQGQGSNLAQYLQSLNQQAIQNQYGEFVRTQPQYNPLIQDMLSMSQVYPPTVSSGAGSGGLGALLGGSGQLLAGGGQGAGAVITALAAAGMI